MRNICAKVRVEDREAIMNEFKQIHQQANKAAVIDVLHAFYAKWNKSYNHVIRNLKDIEPDLLVFYSYPKQIRASIYSTIWSNPLTTLSSVKLSLKQSFQLNGRLILLLAFKRTLFQSNPQRLWSGSGYLRILFWLNKRLKNRSTRKIYLHKKFDSFRNSLVNTINSFG